MRNPLNCHVYYLIYNCCLHCLAGTYDAAHAALMYGEFRDLLIQQLEKVDDKFFEVQDSSEEKLEELAASVWFDIC
jgi:hypothetical protein